jgi:ankyrin repeat protein
MKNWNEKLLKAVKEKSFDDIKICLKYGANIHQDNDYAIIYLSRYGKLDIIKYLFNKYNFLTDVIDETLISAVYLNHIETVNFLISKGATIHKTHEYIIRHAFTYKHYDMVTLLLENGSTIHKYISDEDKCLYFKYMRKNKIKNLMN